MKFYIDLFKSDATCGGDFIMGRFPQLTEQLGKLGAAYNIEETQRALLSMCSLKAPGPDGFQPIFFKETWEITGSALHSFARGVLESGVEPLELLKRC